MHAYMSINHNTKKQTLNILLESVSRNEGENLNYLGDDVVLVCVKFRKTVQCSVVTTTVLNQQYRFVAITAQSGSCLWATVN